jgi:predicted NAD-dependent protein-ADP-ribosyltransferase YbiA (DUF1768 family)
VKVHKKPTTNIKEQGSKAKEQRPKAEGQRPTLFTVLPLLCLCTSILFTFTFDSFAQKTLRDSRYPAHWWAPVSEIGKPDWEILPQEAGPGEVILSKRNELGLLSNFAATPFTFRGKRYASLEGFWQMMLYPEGPNDPRAKHPVVQWKYSRAQVAQLTAFEAKSAGTLAEQNMERMGIDWVTFEGKRFKYRSKVPGEHYRLIVAAMRKKIYQNRNVMQVLLATGDLLLKPDHYGEPNAPPEWRYNEILMMVRRELRSRR